MLDKASFDLQSIRGNLRELQKLIQERELLEQKIVKEEEEKSKRLNQNLMKF